MTSASDPADNAAHEELARQAVSALVRIASDTDHWKQDLHYYLTCALAGATSGHAEYHYMDWLDAWRKRWIAAREAADRDAETAEEAALHEKMLTALRFHARTERALRKLVRQWTRADRQALTACDIREALGLGEEFRDWTEALENVQGTVLVPEIPEDDELIALMEELGIPREDHADIAAAAEALTAVGSPWLWLLERTLALLRSRMGRSFNMPVAPVMPDHGLEGWWFYTVVFLAAAPSVRVFHLVNKVPKEISAASLGILGEKISLYRTGSGYGGLVQHDFVAAVFCGRVYRLEQLDCVAWNERVEVLVPHTAQPLTTVPDQAWADRVHAFLRRLPQEYGEGVQWDLGSFTVKVGGWLLDHALDEYLPEDHELRQFTAALAPSTRTPDPYPVQEPNALTAGDRDAIKHAFGRYVYDLADALSLTPQTDVQHAVIAHLQAGRHWSLPAAGHRIHSEARAKTVGTPAVRPSREIPVVDWRDQPTAEAAWQAYLNGNEIRQDAYGIFSPQHLMRCQRDTALKILRSEGYDIPWPPQPAKTRDTWLGDWGGAWMPADVLAALHTVPEDAAQRAWYQGAKEALDIAWDMHLLWTTDVF
ncbi:hypothetical protein EDD96_6818 [Streptomyces sp. Ag109_G2-6]|nr:hypothetical protein EDD96_6818 [Streptomyces sp. Ag109_G2-6]